MRATWRPLPAWPYPPGRRLVGARLRARWDVGLEALRAVDRHGITSTSEQYAGFAAIGPGGPDPLRGKVIAERHGSVAEALKRTHPDHGGDPRDLADVQAYRKSIGVAAR